MNAYRQLRRWWDQRHERRWFYKQERAARRAFRQACQDARLYL